MTNPTHLLGQLARTIMEFELATRTRVTLTWRSSGKVSLLIHDLDSDMKQTWKFIGVREAENWLREAL